MQKKKKKKKNLKNILKPLAFTQNIRQKVS